MSNNLRTPRLGSLPNVCISSLFFFLVETQKVLRKENINENKEKNFKKIFIFKFNKLILYISLYYIKILRNLKICKFQGILIIFEFLFYFLQ